MKIKYMMLVSLALLILTLASVSATDDANQTVLAQNDDTQELSASWNWTMEADDEIEILPAPDQSMKIKKAPFTYYDNDYNYSLSIDDKDVKVDVFPDWVRFDASNLSYGSHKYELKFPGNNFYKPTSKIGILNVTSIHAEITDTAPVYGDDDFYVVNVYMQNNQSGLLSVYIDDELFDSVNVTADKNANYIQKSFIYYGQLKMGNNTVRIVFNGTGGVFEKSKKINKDYDLGISENFYYGDSKLYLIAPIWLQGTPQVKVNGISHKVNIEYDADDDKIFYITFDKILDVGDYPVELSYSGDSRYHAKTVKDTLHVRAHINRHYHPEGVDIKMPEKANGNLVVDIYDYDGKIVKTVKQKVSNGQANIKFSSSGVYGKFAYVLARYDGSDYEVEDKLMKDVTIGPDINVPASMVVGEKKTVSLDLPGKEGKLIVTAHGAKYKKYTADLVNGKASISLADLPAGEYTLSITFKESLSDGKTESYVEYYEFTVLDHINFANPDSIYYGSAKIKLQCYGENGKVLAGKYLTVKVNGKSLKKVKTDKKGVAYIKLSSKYTPKKYKITVTYNKYKTTKNIKVKQVLSFDKIKVKKSAKKLVFNVNLKKGDKPLKSKKITVKFNGKTYKAKTNKKGIAKFTVKKSVLKTLKAGKKVTVKATYLKTSITKKVKVQK